MALGVHVRFQLLFHVYDGETFVAQGITDPIDCDPDFPASYRFVAVLIAKLGASQLRQKDPGLPSSIKEALSSCWIAASSALANAGGRRDHISNPSLRVMQVIYL
ncbi:MAG: hypothetical protein AAB473_05195 [Patescibacteria group bacterium]